FLSTRATTLSCPSLLLPYTTLFRSTLPSPSPTRNGTHFSCETQEVSATHYTRSVTVRVSTLSTTADHPATTPTKELRLPVSKSGFSCLRDSMNRQPSACSSRSADTPSVSYWRSKPQRSAMRAFLNATGNSISA